MTAYSLLTELFRIERSLTGPGVRRAIDAIDNEITQSDGPFLVRHEVPSGTQCFDWKVPPEWHFRSAYMIEKRSMRAVFSGTRGINVVGYSAPGKREVQIPETQGRRVDILESELPEHVHVNFGCGREQTQFIPYVTAYYANPPTWGVCLSVEQYLSLRPGAYTVEIDSVFLDAEQGGSLTFADARVPGGTTEEIMLHSYVCHPAGLANNECSGPAVLAAVIKWWMTKKRRYTLRVLLAPETIGPIAWLSMMNIDRTIKAGFTLTCMGGPGWFVLQQGRERNYASRIAWSVLNDGDAKRMGWESRVSDERQWCAPGVDLPFATIFKTHPTDPRYRDRYHTSGDDLSFVTEEQIEESVTRMIEVLGAIEADRYWRSRTIGEPQLSRRGLYETTSKVGSSASAKSLLDVLSFCDGRSTLEIAETLGASFAHVQSRIELLKEHGLIEEALNNG